MRVKRTLLALVVAGCVAGCDGGPRMSDRPETSMDAAATAASASAATPIGPVIGPDSLGSLTLGMTVEQAQHADPTIQASPDNRGRCDIRVSDEGRLQFRDGTLVQIEAARDSGAATPEGVRTGDMLGFAAGRYTSPAITSEGVVVAAPGSTTGSSYLFDNSAVAADALTKSDFGDLRVGFIAVRRDGFCTYN